MNRQIAAALSLALLAGTAAAQAPSNLQRMMFVTGTCERLVVAGEDVTGRCRAVVVNLTYRHGRSSFAFSDADRRMISFSGMERSRTGEVVRQTLDLITIARGGGGEVETDGRTATGDCEFGDPFAGPAFIRCTARTAEGDYSASFTTDGEPPRVVDAPPQ